MDTRVNDGKLYTFSEQIGVFVVVVVSSIFALNSVRCRLSVCVCLCRSVAARHSNTTQMFVLNVSFAVFSFSYSRIINGTFE